VLAAIPTLASQRAFRDHLRGDASTDNSLDNATLLIGTDCRNRGGGKMTDQINALLQKLGMSPEI
jgi:hypothetical protein